MKIISFIKNLNLSKFIMLSSLLITHVAQSQIGCMTVYPNGRTLKSHPYYVRCNCPCSSYNKLDYRGRCAQCGHMHENMNLGQ